MLEAVYWFDNGILDFIQEYLRDNVLDALMVRITMLGEWGFLWLAMGCVMLCFRKYRDWGIVLLTAVVCAMLLGDQVIKPLVGRVRPCNINPDIPLLIPAPKDFSFPSGHAGGSFAGVAVLWHVRREWRIPALLLALVICFSRLYLYVHYPTDVLGGMLLGTGVGLFFFAAYLKYCGGRPAGLTKDKPV